MDKKKTTNKLDAQELEKRKAPFASPITYREGEGRTTEGATETATPRRQAPGETTPPTLPKTPIIYRES